MISSTSALASLLGSIPSPGFNSIGPFTLYGLSIGLGVAAAVILAQNRWTKVGGHEDDMASIAFVAVPAGVVGARLYHVVTDFQLFRDQPWYQVFLVNEGGLGIPGGILFGVLAGLWAAKRRGLSISGALDAAVPGLPLAQAIGRLGNYFNQELYGRPTDLPWGLEIDGEHRNSIPEEFRDVDAFATFHPTFLYEMLWNLALVLVILRVDRLKVLPRGRLIAVYLFGYGLGRLWVEALRIDAVNTIFGLRLNIWMSLGLIIGGIAMVFWPTKDSAEDDADTSSDDEQDDEDDVVELTSEEEEDDVVVETADS